PLQVAVTLPPRATLVGVAATLGVTVSALPVASLVKPLLLNSRSSYVPPAIVVGIGNAQEPAALAAPGGVVQLTYIQLTYAVSAAPHGKSAIQSEGGGGGKAGQVRGGLPPQEKRGRRGQQAG